jgi:hypothetical protein
VARLVGFAGGALVLGPDEAPPADDTTPDAFSFTAQTGVAASSVRTSESVTITGINVATPISVAGGEYSISGGAFTSLPGTVNNNDTIRLRHTASPDPETQVDTVANIGGVTGTFSSTTAGLGPVFDGPNILDMILMYGLEITELDFSGLFSSAADISYAIDGELPDGVSLTSAGVLTGVPLETGSFTGLTVVAHPEVPSRTPRARRTS